MRKYFIEPVETEMTPELLNKYLAKHRALFPRYKELMSAYCGEYGVDLSRADWKPDNHLVANYAKYIVDTMNGFFIGVPVRLHHDNDKVNEYLNFLDVYNDQDDNNAELSKICSIYGNGFEMVYNDELGNIGITYMTPLEAFIIYDDSVLRRPMYGVRWYLDADNIICGSWCDATSVQYFSCRNGTHWTSDPIPHYFGDLPIIEYVENEEGLGIFENVLSLIKETNKALSEKANDVDYYADAYLKILGAQLDEPTLHELRRNRIINFPGLDTDKLIVEFLQKPDADGTQEHLLDRLEKLIFQISMVSNISETDFGQASGVALKYRLQGMQNLRRTKERKFTSGLNRRYKLIAHNPASPMAPDDWIGIQYRFTANIPNNLLEESEIAGNLSGVTSRQTQLSVLSCVEDTSKELAEIEKEADTLEYATDYPIDRV